MYQKLIATLIILLGVGIIGYAGWEIFDSISQSEESILKARKVVAEGTKTNEEESDREGQVSANNGEVIGVLSIPSVSSELAVVEGTNPDDLEKGVGHYKGSSYPGDNGQIVLSGHRDTVFQRLGELEFGDELILDLANGTFSYEIVDTKIVDADDRSIITLQKEKEELILTTCYPFGYIGNAPQRYIIYAEKK
ncbi:class D sortase [Mesobacillus maritimus]|uniref:Class D sortase n=1 Tax=Mesobacillus maritimus TaxID=1643336 RepID=A0ABS7K4S9_9BACI|nr:class D sortase [Mesobacillus maritimus]MBY0097279.1 class D sortase [Mesobacillus maritimus]